MVAEAVRGGRRREAWLIVTVVMGLLLAGCAGGSAVQTAAPQLSRTWHLVEVRTGGTTLSTIPNNRQATVRFDEKQLVGADGVNPYQADYSSSGDHFTVFEVHVGLVGITQETPEESEVVNAIRAVFEPSTPTGVSMEEGQLVLTAGAFALVFD